MENLKNLEVIDIHSSHEEFAYLMFDNGYILRSSHDTECFESHWLDFTHIDKEDFKGLIFDLSNDEFFERIPGFGIALKPINNHPVRIPAYNDNNGFYGSNLSLELLDDNDTVVKEWDISECQDFNSAW